ncbi:TRAP transporter small permease [Neobacillus sp. MM2021_6]|uniref:TRAP transporter small permease n=1 Tax=Bacillaceae TaxID=186817 RepID=UPI00140AAD1C|nr:MULTISPECIES: TRAP transporter small permease [Bacillaceae]MBO0959925.1 TRAP transporter small permease [Neobacillus sp. MM2021_6]NHC18874.1 TRAP transporter small permease [Bacillus sp. MM2020_4]
MSKVFKKVDHILAYISSFALFSMMLLIFINAISRFLFNKPVTGVIEFTGEYLMVMVVYLAMSFTQKNEGHVKVEILQKRLSARLTFLLDILVKILSASIFAILTYTSYLLFIRHLNQDIRFVSSLAYPLTPAVFMICFGSFVMSIRLFISIFTAKLGTSGSNIE